MTLSSCIKYTSDCYKKSSETVNLGGRVTLYHSLRWLPHQYCIRNKLCLWGHSISNRKAIASHLSNFGSNFSYMFIFI